MKIVSTQDAPEARGHYSQAIVHGGMVYVAGQLPGVPGDVGRRLESFDDQARQVVANVAAILEASGSSLHHVVKATVYIADIADWPAFNAIYAEAFGAHRPARTVVPVAGLHYGYRVEMDVIAALTKDPRDS
jgi:2-iminobutanoate/2-iminopropanoate deaminase